MYSVRKQLKARRKLETRILMAERVNERRREREELARQATNVAQTSTSPTHGPEATIGRFVRVCTTVDGVKARYTVQESVDGQNWCSVGCELQVGGIKLSAASFVSWLKKMYRKVFKGQP